MRILIVEDEIAIAEVEKAYMERDGYSADIASDGLKALEMFAKNEYGLVLLDLMLPKLSGIDVCREIRKKSDVPIIMLTARSGEDDVVSGLDVGADDYVVKPFSPKVLMARIRANTRGSVSSSVEKKDADGKILKIGDDIEIDMRNYAVRKKGNAVSLTRNEFMIFSTMAARPEKTFSRDELITYALGYEYDGFERSIDSYIKNIRKKLGDDNHPNGCIKTVHGFGYRISEE